MIRRGIAIVLAVGGVAAVSVGMVGAERDEPSEFTVEALPTPISSTARVQELTADDVLRGQESVDDVVAKLQAQHPSLGKLKVSDSTPVYREGEAVPSAVSVELALISPTSLTMDLVRTVVDDKGVRSQQAQPSQIQNLRGLILNVSLETGDVLALYPAPYAADVNDPERATVVNVIDAEKYQLYPDGDPRGEEE